MINILSGILIGTCMILPGVSGSVVAIMLGVYEKIIILLNRKDVTSLYKLRKIFPIAFGILIGIFIFGKILLVFYNKYTYEMMYTFIGLILASIPMLNSYIKKNNEELNIKWLSISFLLSVILFIMPKILNIGVENNLNFFNLFLGGFLYISGKIIPGISSSFFLMILGLYEYVLSLILNPFSITTKIIPFILGIIIGLYIMVKLINYLLNNYFSSTYSAIIGFVLGSTFALFPGFELSERTMVSFLLMVSSFILVNKLSKK